MTVRISQAFRLGLHVTGFCVLAAGVWSLPGKAGKTTAVKKIDYNRDVRQIITKCFTCHGHDSKAVAADLRLDQFDSATKKLPSGEYAIVPGHPEKSELIERIYAKNALLMPPKSSNKVLSDEEKAILKKWIEEGAEYKQHWAWVKPVRPALPVVKLKSWARNPIDTFILATLEEKGLKPSPEADNRTLIRRVSLDLTGIPPTPAEVNAFLKDKSPKAYEKVVDRLLASKRYGERMAMDWMDYARYADSNGYQADFERYQWRWRDWVIDAYNKNMPFDQFSVEQLAGDLLPHPTLDQRIATGFNRNHRINTEGGVIAEEWRVETVIDRVETTSATWLGLTSGCARCHDHKYDPISQKDFYSMCAFFNNVPESGTGVERPENHPPYIAAPYPEQTRRISELTSKLAMLNTQMAGQISASTSKALAWKGPDAANTSISSEAEIARYTFSSTPTADSATVSAPKVEGDVSFDLGRSTGSASLGEKGYLNLGQAGDFDGSKPFSYGYWINPGKMDGSSIAKMDVANNYKGWDCFLQGGRPAPHFISDWPSNALKVVSKRAVPMGQWSHIAVTYDGSKKPEGVKIYINGELTEHDTEANALKGSIQTPVPLLVGRRTGDTGIQEQVDDLVLYNRVLTAAEAAKLASVNPAVPYLRVPAESRTKPQQDAIVKLYCEATDAKYRSLADQAKAAASERDSIKSKITTVMVMEDMPKPRDCFVLIRGLYDKHGDKVEAATPSFLPKIPAGYANNRLGFAKWIVSPENPLTARVAVNRFWERFFGAGLVPTSEDFGTRAEFPTHPELLDWLATEFVRLKWDQKALLKEIVTSATYRQTSDTNPAAQKIDPQNRYLAHAPRFRMTAEVLRDQALSVAGLLVEKIGGPSVRPYQPDGVWDELNVYGNLRNYKHDKDSGLHRRSLYTIWKRTAAPPEMTLFDMSTRETCRVRRARTNTPLQALVMLNDVTYFEAARILANRMIASGGTSPADRLKYAYEWTLSRPPSQKEANLLEASLSRRIAHYRNNPAAAKKLISIGDVKNTAKADTAELAAYTVLASTILNMDETLTKE